MTRNAGARQVARGVVIGAAVAFGVLARFITTSPMWLDEALSVNIAALPIGDISEALRHDGHPPLYYWLLHGWMQVVGDGDVAIRAFSGVLSVAALPLAWVAGKEIGGRRVGWLSLLVVALSPYAVRYATEARMYSLVMLLVLVGWLSLVRVLRGESFGWAVLLGGTAALMPWTHYWTIYLLVATGAVLLWRGWRRRSERRRVALALGAMALGAVTFLAWLPVLLDQAAHTGTPWADPARPTQVFVETLDALGGGNFAEARTYGIIFALVVLVAVCSEQATDGRLVLVGRVVLPVRAVTLVVVGTAVIGSSVGIVSATAFHPRYAAVFVPMLLVLGAVGLARRGAGALVGTATAVVMILGVVGIVHNATWARTQSEGHAERILAERSADDVVVACPDQLGPSLERALSAGGGPTPIPYPTAGDPRFVDWRDYEERNDAFDPVAFAADVLDRAGEAPIWVVWNPSYETFDGDCEAVLHALGQGRSVTVQVPMDSDAYEPSLLYRFE